LTRPCLVRLMLMAQAAGLQVGEESAHRQWRDLGGGRQEAFQPPAVGAQGGLGAAPHLLGQQERLDGLAKGVSVGFFAGFWRRGNG